MSLKEVNRAWMLHPRPVRTVYRVNAEIFGMWLGVLVVGAIVVYVAKWLTRR